MQRNRIAIFATALVCTALLYAISNANASGAGPQVLRSNQPIERQYEITGVIQTKNGNVWMIDGQDYTVDPATITGGSGNVGETVSLNVSVLKNAQPAQSAADATPTAMPSEKSKTMGVVTAMDASSITIGGVVYSLSEHPELEKVKIGDIVKVEFFTAADGTLIAHEVETAGETHTQTEMQPSPGSHESDDKHDDSNDGQNSGSGYQDDDDEDDSSGMNQTGSFEHHDDDHDEEGSGENSSGND